MLVATGSLGVGYSQIVVSNSAIDNPFNDWAQRHVDQGFSWRPGSVAFGTLENYARCDVEVWVNAIQDRPDPAAVRVIQTPFQVSSEGSITIESVISYQIMVKLDPGQYNLWYECFASALELQGRIKLVFTRTDTPSFAILRADPGLRLDGELLLTAEPA
jgi:hypothetical protein